MNSQDRRGRAWILRNLRGHLGEILAPAHAAQNGARLIFGLDEDVPRLHFGSEPCALAASSLDLLDFSISHGLGFYVVKQGLHPRLLTEIGLLALEGGALVELVSSAFFDVIFKSIR